MQFYLRSRGSTTFPYPEFYKTRKRWTVVCRGLLHKISSKSPIKCGKYKLLYLLNMAFAALISSELSIFNKFLWNLYMTGEMYKIGQQFSWNFFTEFHPSEFINMEFTARNLFTPKRNYDCPCAEFQEIAWQLLVKNFFSGYYENPADGLVSDIRSQTDRSFLHIRYFLLHEGILKLLLTSIMWTISILVPGFWLGLPQFLNQELLQICLYS